MSEEPNKPKIYTRSKGELQSRIQPIVLEYKSGKKNKKEQATEEDRNMYSKGLEDIQQAEADAIGLARRAVKAVSKGMDTYDRERSRSAKEKKDGAIEDFPYNSAKAFSAGLKEASEIPLDLVESITAKNYRQLLRKSLKRASKALRIFRI